MKKLLFSLTILLASVFFASAQVIPSFQFGIKGGINLSKFSTSGTFNSENRAGYLGGIWARFGALGINAQPEVYFASKTISSTGDNIELNSIDVPLLVGYKFGAFGLGGRIATGPMASFILNSNQSFGTALGNVATLNFKNQAYAWQFGGGIDIAKISVDLRYELGLTNLSNSGYDSKLNMFSLALAVKL